MIIPFLILLLIITINLGSVKLLLLLLTIFGFFITGILDDYLSIKKKREHRFKNKREINFTKCHLNNFYIVSLRKKFNQSINNNF